MARPSKKLTPITQTQWDKMKSKGLDPKELGFRVKGERGNNNIESASPEIQKPFKEFKAKLMQSLRRYVKIRTLRTMGII